MSIPNSGSTSRYGVDKGIQGFNNSCYLDAIMFALFYGNKGMDETLLRRSLVEDDRYAKFRITIKNVVLPKLRKPPYFCTYQTEEDMEVLRKELEKLNPRVNGQMMDVGEIIPILLQKALSQEAFIHYGTGTSNFIHQIVTSRAISSGSATRGKIMALQNLFTLSMLSQALKLARPPNPALIIKVPRSDGRLIGCEKIIPDLYLNFTSDFFQNGHTHVRMELVSVICLKNRHYTCFTREGTSSILYFDSMASGTSSVKLLPSSIYGILESLSGKTEDELRTIVSSASFPKELTKMFEDIHICIYCPFGDYVPVATLSVTNPTRNERRPSGSRWSMIPSCFQNSCRIMPSSYSRYIGWTTNMENYSSRAGKVKGIQSMDKDNAIGTALYSLLCSTKAFDSWIIDLNNLKTPEASHRSKNVASTKRQISSKLRTPPYFCDSILIQALLNVMDTSGPEYGQHSMDISTVLKDLFDKNLNLQPFIRYTARTTDYMHHIVLNTYSSQTCFHNFQTLFIESMKNQDLKFVQPPMPGLLIKLPMSSGKLVVDGIVPVLKLDIEPVMGNRSHYVPVYRLVSIITLKGRAYTPFVKVQKNIFSWIWGHGQWEMMTTSDPPEIIGVDFSKLKNLTISDAQKILKNDPSASTSMRLILENAYILIYVPEN